MSRLFGSLSLLVAAFYFPASLHAVEKTSQAPRIVCLTCREFDRIERKEFPPPLLARELVRQAFLIAAREECGLLTRDQTLREEFPPVSDPRVALFDFYVTTRTANKGVDYCYTLSRSSGKTAEKLWDWKFHVDVSVAMITIKTPESITDLAERAEALSRGPLKDLLKREARGPSVPAARTASKLPARAEEEIWTWNELAILGGLRRVHAEIGEKGESPELLGALAVGYANLGMVTEYYFSAAPKAWSARGLLYAERLVRQSDHSAWALSHRAYVRAIVGLHHLAEADLAAANEKQAASKPARPLPFWTGVLTTFLKGKVGPLLAQAKSPAERRLAQYLAFEAAMWAQNNDLRVKSAESVVGDCSDCFRAFDGMCAMHSLGVVRTVTEHSFELLSKTLRRRMPEVPGLPQALAKQIKQHQPLADRSDEIDFRVQFIADVKKAARTGDDTMEPSLAALGQTIEEIEFKQVMRRLELERYIWGIPADETITTFRRLCEKHPYGGFVDLFSTSPLDVLKGIATLVPRIDPAELTIMHSGPLRMGQNYDPKRIGHWLQVIYAHSDPVLRDEILGMEDGAAGKPDQPQYNGPYMKMVASTSSYFPVVIAAQITRNWNEIKSRAATIEKDCADEPLVQSALMNKYRELKQYADAERCAKRRIALAPDYPAYHTLADIYKQQGDMTRWQATLEESLRLPSLGLEEFQVRNQIARYHMGRKEWSEALPWAEGAAASYSAWGLETAARCHEMLGHWEKSEALMRARSERYENSAFDWMVWCERTGHGDVQAASRLARKQFESLGTAATPVQLEWIGVFYLFENEPEKALTVFEKAYGRSKNVYLAMHAAVIADRLGKTEERDRNLSRLALAGLQAKPKTIVKLYARVAGLMKASLPPASVRDLNFKELDAVLEEGKTGARRIDTNLKYFIGMFLLNRDPEKARYYLVRSAQTAQYLWQNQALACRQLRELKVPFVPLGDEKADPQGSSEP